MDNDVDIWNEFRSGSKSALSYIYFQNYPSMFQYGIKFDNNPEFIKDCIQDVFFMLIQAGEKLGSTNNIRFYLLKSLKNKILKELGKKQRGRIVEAPVFEFDSRFILEDELSQKEECTKRENALENALKKLSNRQREIIYLRFECELDYNQICELMQLKYDSARQLVLRAINSLRKIIDAQNNTPILFFLRFATKSVL